VYGNVEECYHMIA